MSRFLGCNGHRNPAGATTTERRTALSRCPANQHTYSQHIEHAEFEIDDAQTHRDELLEIHDRRDGTRLLDRETRRHIADRILSDGDSTGRRHALYSYCRPLWSSVVVFVARSSACSCFNGGQQIIRRPVRRPARVTSPLLDLAHHRTVPTATPSDQPRYLAFLRALRP